MSVTNPYVDLVNSFRISKRQPEANIIEFSESSWGLGVPLLPVEKFTFKLFYGIPLATTEAKIEITDKFREKIFYKLTEKEFLSYLYNEGCCNVGDEGTFWNEAVLVLGRRGTKTSMAALLECYEAYRLILKEDPLEYYGQLGEDFIGLLNLANALSQSSKLFSLVRSFVEKSMFFAPYIVGRPSSTELFLKSPADLKRYKKSSMRFSILMSSYGCNARTSRGGGNIVLSLDEFAHFIDNGGNQSDEQIYNAVTPSVISFKRDGKILILSTPLNKSGKFYEFYTKAREGDKTRLMLQIPTWIANNTLDSETLHLEYKKDPSKYDIELGVQFSDRYRGFISREEDLDACFPKNEAGFYIRKEQVRGIPGVSYYLGLDLGVRNDGTGMVVVHNEEPKIVVDYANVYYPGLPPFEDKIDRLSMKHDVVPLIDSLYDRFRIVGGVFDQWGGTMLEDELLDIKIRSLTMVDFTDRLNSEIYTLLLQLILEQNIEFYDNPILRNELLTLQRTDKHKGLMKVEAPKMADRHDDLSDGLARACWSARGGHLVYLGLAPKKVKRIVNPAILGGSGMGSKAQGLVIFRRQYLKLLQNKRLRSR